MMRTVVPQLLCKSYVFRHARSPRPLRTYTSRGAPAASSTTLIATLQKNQHKKRPFLASSVPSTAVSFAIDARCRVIIAAIPTSNTTLPEQFYSSRHTHGADTHHNQAHGTARVPACVSKGGHTKRHTYVWSKRPGRHVSREASLLNGVQARRPRLGGR